MGFGKRITNWMSNVLTWTAFVGLVAGVVVFVFGAICMMFAWFEDVPVAFVLIAGVLAMGVACFALVGMDALWRRIDRRWKSKKHLLVFERFEEGEQPKQQTKRGYKWFIVIRNAGSQEIGGVSVQIESVTAIDSTQKYQNEHVSVVANHCLCMSQHDTPQSEADLPIPKEFDLGPNESKQVSLDHLWEEGKCYLLITEVYVIGKEPFRWGRRDEAKLPPGKWRIVLFAKGSSGVIARGVVEIDLVSDTPMFKMLCELDPRTPDSPIPKHNI